MKTKKYTKKQINAIECLIWDLDELDNKPRRLFETLRNYTKAFIESEEKLNEIIDSIDQFEDMYYRFKSTPEYARDIFQSREKVLRQMRSNEKKRKPKESAMYEIREALDMMTQESIKNLTDL